MASKSEPWVAFLRDVDDQVKGPTELHCLGGFVLALLYGLPRPTADVDSIEVRGVINSAELQVLAGKGSPLAVKHRMYIDIVAIATYPDEYEQRLSDVLASELKHLRVRVFELHDLVLAKLPRNADYDREDVKFLARGPGLDVSTLRQRYTEELRWQLGNPERHDLTLELWTAMIEEIRA